jgi:guanylate kinase
MMLRKKGLIFVISGPSGSGKTTLAQKLTRSKTLKNRLIKSISFTTRPKRQGEADKRDYFFISDKEFREKRKAKKILEWTKYLDYYYATPKEFVDRQLDKGKHILLCLDFKGALEVKRLYPQNTITIFVTPPSLVALQDRIRKRCRQTKKEEIKQRLKLARQELAVAKRYNYCVVNRDLQQAVKELQGIILQETYI